MAGVNPGGSGAVDHLGEAMRLEPGWSYSCRAMLYAANAGQLFSRIPVRFLVLVGGGRAGVGWGAPLGNAGAFRQAARLPRGFVDRRFGSLTDGLDRVQGLGLGCLPSPNLTD